MPAQAGIQAFLLDSRQKHAGMTVRVNGHFILWRGTKSVSKIVTSMQVAEKVISLD